MSMLKLLPIIAGLFFITGIYDYNLPPDFQGAQINLNDYQGKKILIVNTASNSIYVSQYERLETLYQLYKDSLVIIAVPSNSFENEQESDSIITGFVSNAYHITYLLAGKTEVAGAGQHPLFHWLENKNENGSISNIISGDFQKFLIDETGKLIGVFSAAVDPLSDEIQDPIKNIDN